jgi:hypothetical protein
LRSTVIIVWSCERITVPVPVAVELFGGTSCAPVSAVTAKQGGIGVGEAVGVDVGVAVGVGVGSAHVFTALAVGS